MKHFLSAASSRHGRRQLLARFRADRRASSGVEFALVAPLMLTMFCGTIVWSDAIAIQRKVTIATRTITDLVTQYVTISTADLDANLAAAASILAPYPSANLIVTVSEVQTNAGGAATVTWSRSYPSQVTARPAGQAIALPTQIANPGIALIMGEVQYAYSPPIVYEAIGTQTLHDMTYMAPRLSGTVSQTP